MKTAAFFDIDGTLYRDSLMVDHFKKLIKYEVLDPGIWHGEAKKKFENWDKRHGDYEDYLLEVAEVYRQGMTGLNKEYVDFITNQVIKLRGERVYKYTRGRIKWHLDQGHEVILISGSPKFLVKRMAEKYNVKHYSATEYLIDENNKYTGELIQMWESKDKIIEIDKYVKELDIDLSSSYAYGDTNGDLSMLKKVGNPIVINPIRKLVENIKIDDNLRSIIQIIIERKDVIYCLRGDVDIIDSYESE